jgi:hypothetical protein
MDTTLYIVLFILLVACIVIGVWYTRQNRAKKEARMILAAGRITDQRSFERTMRLLANMKNDLEANDLRQKLLALEKKGG